MRSAFSILRIEAPPRVYDSDVTTSKCPLKESEAFEYKICIITEIELQYVSPLI